MKKYIFFVCYAFMVVSLPNLSDSHNKKIASDGCHKSGDSYHCHSADETITFESNHSGYYTISEVLDGDTLDLTYGEGVMQVRLFGIDTPETSKGRKLTSDAEAVLKGKGITKSDADYAAELEAEKARQLQLGEASKTHVKDALQGKDVFFLFDDTDVFPFIKQGKYGRYLTYVFYEADGVTHFLNIDLIEGEYADLDYIDTPFRYRWAFISEDLGEVVEMFSDQSLPAVNAPNAPHLQKGGITTTWAEIKR